MTLLRNLEAPKRPEPLLLSFALGTIRRRHLLPAIQVGRVRCTSYKRGQANGQCLLKTTHTGPHIGWVHAGSGACVHKWEAA